MSDALADYGGFADMAPLLVKRDQLRAQGLGDGAVLILPPGILAGVTQAYGMPVIRADVPEPMIGLPGEKRWDW